MSASEGTGGSGSIARPTEDIPAQTVELERVARLLSQGEMELLGQILSSSNIIFLTQMDDGDLQALAIYKPSRGETPLWDFPYGTLGLREMAAYVVSRALGWPLVPPIALRDGIHGAGTVQLYITAEPDTHYFTLREDRPEDLMPVALFDVLVNNADRKGGHLLQDRWGRIWAIDNALTFHTEPKLRTVVWDFAGEVIPQDYLSDLIQLQEVLVPGTELHSVLFKLLHADEISALQARLRGMLTRAVFPQPDPTRRQIPWPII